MVAVTTEQIQTIAKWGDPVYFVNNVIGEPMYRKQGEILHAVQKNPYTSIVGANGTGKDWTTGRLICWWLAMHEEAVVVVLGPSYRQVYDIVWKEVRVAWASALERGNPLGGRMGKEPRWEINDKRYAVGFSTQDEFNIQGYHSIRLLLVITEAHAVADSHIDAGFRLNPARVVFTGNPFTSSGKFYESHHGERELWKTISLSAFDTPNVIARKEVVNGLVTYDHTLRRKAELGEDHPMYVGGILGKFPTNLGSNLISLEMAKEAVTRDLKPTGPTTIGVDVAREGEDKTVVVRRDGGVSRILWVVQGKNTDEVAGWVAEYISTHNPTGDRQGYVVIDTVGVGGGVYDRLITKEYRDWTFQEFKGGGRAIDSERYKDKNAEGWYSVREALLKEDLCFKVGCECNGEQFSCQTHIDDVALDRMVAQLSSRGYSIEGDRKIKLESKADLAKKGKRSPDEADALAMTYSVVENVLEVW
tara:strand:+ start:1879 stop:3303 length:1425 start_codon:yes stop_codon:yes gene_type:complete